MNILSYGGKKQQQNQSNIIIIKTHAYFMNKLLRKTWKAVLSVLFEDFYR